METKYLRTLKVVLESGSFSRAAEALCITQSAVSQRIKLLEDQYGCQLIDRSGSVLTPTSAGKRIMKKIMTILKAVEEIEADVKDTKSKAQFSIGFTPTFGATYLSKVMSHFVQDLGKENVNLKFIVQQPEQLIKLLLDHEFDGAIIEHCDCLPSLNIFNIYPLPLDNMVLVSSPSLSIPSEVTSLEKIFEYNLITRKEGCSSRCLMELNLRHAGFDFDNFRGIIVYDDLYLIKQEVLKGHGIAFVSRELVSENIQSGELCEHGVSGFNFTRLRSLIISQNSIKDQYIKDFVESVHSVFKMQSPFVASKHPSAAGCCECV